MTFLPTIAVNGASAMPSDREHLAMLCLQAAAEHAALVVATEMDDLDDDSIAKALGPDVDAWWWVHSNRPSRDGLLIAGRHDRTSHGAVRYFDGAPASPVNDPREILRVRVEVDRRWSMTIADLHAPKDPNGLGWLAHTEMIRNSRLVGAQLLVGDFNVRKPAMRRYYPDRTIRSAGVLHMAASSTLSLSAARPIDLLPGQTGDDHRALKSVIHPTRKRR